MTTGKRNKLWKRLEAILLIAVMLVVCSVPSVTEAATDSIQKVEDIDFSDFSNWRSGVYYHTNGKYEPNDQRICLNNYVTFTNKAFTAHITDTSYKLLVRELNASKSFLRTVTLVNGQKYEPGSSAVYLAISLYKGVGVEHGVSYTTYKTMFANGFVAELCAIKNTSTNTSTSTDVKESEVQTEKYDVEDIDFSEFLNWKSGCYHWTTGKYEVRNDRICLNDYVSFRNKEYTVSISASGYHLLIREMDKNLKFIKSHDLANGATFIPGQNVEYLAITIYKTSGSDITYNTYKTLFANGFEAKLQVVSTKDDIIVEDIPVIENVMGSVQLPTLNSSSPSTGKELFYSKLKNALVTGNSSVIDVTGCKVTDIEFYQTHWPKLKEECYLEYQSGKGIYPTITCKDGYIVSFQYKSMDADFANRLNRVRTSVNEYLTMIDSKMSDLDKILLAHEYVVNRTEYKSVSDISYTAGGPLGDGYGVCMGYAYAMMVLLHEADIETAYVSSSTMNHGWVYVKLNDNWYHIDPTWDDTRKGDKQKYIHRFLLRNDAEFKENDVSHYDWKVPDANVASTSTKYKNWYVHDVAGTMYYYDGLWYYWDINTNSILCSDVEGSKKQTIYDGSKLGTITLKGISNGMLSYSIGSKVYYIDL